MPKKPLILSVEDRPSQQNIIRLMSEKKLVMKFTLCPAASSTYQLILMDWFMHDMDGFECTKLIRQAEVGTGRHIPILAVTAHAQRGDREKCLAAGMDDYMSKPFTASQFHELILKWTKKVDANVNKLGDNEDSERMIDEV